MSVDRGRPTIAETFDRTHPGRVQSTTLEEVYRTAFGDEYPEGAQPNAFFSRTTLLRLAEALRGAPSSTVVDLGCGHGGPGLWVVQHTGANLIGIDLSPVGIELARARAVDLGLTDKARFQVGDISDTGLPDASCDAAMSLDVLLMVPDKLVTLREIARILRPAGRFVFTTWEQEGYSERLGSPQVADHRPLLEAAGFAVETYEQPPDWRRHQQALLEGIISAEAQLTTDMGAGFVAMARGSLAELPNRRYCFIVATRT